MKKKILLLSDDIRTTSGVGRVSKDIVLGTCDMFDWVQLSARLSHPENGSIIDVSKSVASITGVSNPNVKLYSNSGYGDEITLTRLLELESPDAILHITDPRQWSWLYAMERKIRGLLPICYYHVWDNYPIPKFNEYVYRSCDYIACISKLTHDIVSSIDKTKASDMVEYIPHGVDELQFTPLNDEETNDFKRKLCNGNQYDFILLANNVNIPRKQLPCLISSYKTFCDELDNNVSSRCLLVLHTNPKFSGGADLRSLTKNLCPSYNIAFSDHTLDDESLNLLYNSVDVTVNIASNEGFGLSTLESIMAGTPTILSETGGHIDQIYDSGGDVGKWCRPVKPRVKNLTGSQQVPYIYSDLCHEDDVSEAIKYWHDMSREERKKRGLLGREFAVKNLCKSVMTDKISCGINKTINNFVP